MYCSNCGTLLVTGAKFCHLCGEVRPAQVTPTPGGESGTSPDAGQPFIPATQVFEMFPPLAAPTVDEPIAQADQRAQQAGQTFPQQGQRVPQHDPVPSHHDGDAPTRAVDIVAFDGLAPSGPPARFVDEPPIPRGGRYPADADTADLNTPDLDTPDPSWVEAQQQRPAPYGHADPGWRPDDPSQDPTDPEAPSPFSEADWAAVSPSAETPIVRDQPPAAPAVPVVAAASYAEPPTPSAPALGPNATMVQPVYTGPSAAPATEVNPAVSVAGATPPSGAATVADMPNPANGPQWVVPPTRSAPTPPPQNSDTGQARRRWPMALLCGYLVIASVVYAAWTSAVDTINTNVAEGFWDAVPTSLPWDAISGFSDWNARDQFQVVASVVTVVFAVIVLVLLAARARKAAGAVGMLVAAGLVATAVPKALNWADARDLGITFPISDQMRAFGISIAVSAVLALVAFVLSIRLLKSKRPSGA
jgi:hypothetical protein